MAHPSLQSYVVHPLNEKYKFLSIFTLPDYPHVVIVSLDRPQKRNAINAQMWREIGDSFHSVGSMGDGCRCVLLTGNGKSFCAGIDISDPEFGLTSNHNHHHSGKADHDHESLESPDYARQFLSFRSKILDMQRAISSLEICPVPVVAAIHGACIGGGVDLTCCADIRLCSPDAKFSVREVKLGLAADVGTLQRFPKIVGHGSRVRELCLTGENFDAVEAARIGYVSQISTCREELIPMALQVCGKIAVNSPVAVTGTKASLNYSRDHTVREGLEHIALHNAAALGTRDIMASFSALSKSKKPRFMDLLPCARL